MADRPIIFSAPMVRALLDGRKSQTRRVIKKPAAMDALAVFSPTFLTLSGNVDYLGFAPGDRLYVREAHYLTDDGDYEHAVFAEDAASVAGHLDQMARLKLSHPQGDWSKHLRLRPSIHMPRWASRLTLTVTDVRVQRLQDISEADAVAEGLVSAYEGWATDADASHWGNTAVNSYRVLWNDLHGPDAWDANPWVAAISFTVNRGNIDQMEAANG